MKKTLETTRSAITNSWSNPNPESIGVFNMINSVYPAFAQKIFQNNEFMRKMVMSGMSPMHILEYPICGRCETLAAFSDPVVKNGKAIDTCSCFATGCGHKTIDPITFKQWLLMEMRKKAPADFVEKLEFAVDVVAMAMVRKYLLEAKQAMQSEQGTIKRQLGLVDMYGNAIKEEQQEHYKVTLEETSDKIDLEEEAMKIGREEKLDVQHADE